VTGKSNPEKEFGHGNSEARNKAPLRRGSSTLDIATVPPRKSPTTGQKMATPIIPTISEPMALTKLAKACIKPQVLPIFLRSGNASLKPGEVSKADSGAFSGSCD